MKTGIIFDLDGTLWNATENIMKSWQEVIDKKGISEINLTQETLSAQMGKLMEEIADNLFSNISIPARYELLQECCIYENQYLSIHGGRLYDGVEEVFEKLHKKYNIFIVSNCQQGYIETFLEYSHLEKYVSDIEDAGNTGLPKSQNIKLIIKRNHLDKAFYVGDTFGDMKATDEAGIPFIHAAYGFGTIPEERISIRNIKELPDLIDSILEKE